MIKARWATKEEIVFEFQKCPNDDNPKTVAELTKFIREAVRDKRFSGSYVEFVFDRGEIDDMPRFFSLNYQLEKEDVYGPI